MSVYLLLSLMLLGHVLCDFYFQTEKCVKAKKFPSTPQYYEFMAAHFFHALTHAVVITAIVIAWFYSNSGKSEDHYSLAECLYIFSATALILLFSHLFIDILKEYTSTKISQYNSLIFLADQFLHVAILFGLVLKFFYNTDPFNSKATIHLELLSATIFLLSLFLLLRPASIFIVIFMSSKQIGGISNKIQITKSFLAGAYYLELAKHYSSNSGTTLHDELEKSKDKAEQLVAFLSNGKLEVSSHKAFDSNGAGKWIGYIERVMIFVFFIFNQPAAIAGIMAIKTAFRFNDLKDDNDSARSEYIMIGTFLSFFITMIIAATAKFSIESIWDGSQVKIMDFDILYWLSTYF